MAMDFGDGQQDETIAVLPRHIRPRTDKGQINCAFAQQFIDLGVGFPLHQFQISACLVPEVSEELPVKLQGLFGGNHGGHGHRAMKSAPGEPGALLTST